MADHRIAQHRLRCHGQPSTVGTPVGFWEQYGLHWPFQELPMAKPNLSSMSVDALLRLRDEIEQVLTRRVAQLRDELSRLGRQIGSKAKVRGRSPLKGRTIPVKYKDRSGHLEKFLSPSRHESDSVTARGHGRMERAGHGAEG